jgi:hypothetical protein
VLIEQLTVLPADNHTIFHESEVGSDEPICVLSVIVLETRIIKKLSKTSVGLTGKRKKKWSRLQTVLIVSLLTSSSASLPLNAKSLLWRVNYQLQDKKLLVSNQQWRSCQLLRLELRLNYQQQR